MRRGTRITRTRAVLALACTLGLVAGACGGDEEGGETAATTAGSSATTAAATTAAATTAASTNTSGSPTSNRAASTTTAGATTTARPGGAAGGASGFGTSVAVAGGPYGQSPDNPELYVGAGGFEIDLAECPSDYDPIQGITDTEIRLGISLPKSGPLAGFGLLADGMNSYFQYVNETQGGIDGRQIVLDVKDDAYEPARTKTNVDELLQSGDYAGFVTILGTANNLGVWDDINEECMPQLLNGTGGVEWGDVENHPWTTGMQIDYFTEAGLWAEWLKDTYPDGVQVAALTFNNDFGKSYSNGFKAAIEGTNIELVSEELHDPTAPNLTNQFTSLASSGAEVLLIQTSGAFCTQAMGEVERGQWKPTVMMSATCGSLTQFFKPLVDQGLTGAGTHIIQTFKDPNDEAFAADPFVQLFKETTAAQGLDSTQSTYFTGWIFGWYAVEILNLASTLEGGLTRPNFVIANRSIEAQHPALLPGLTGRMVGLEDAYLTEGGRVAQYTVTDPTQLGTFEPISEVINLEGELGTYANVGA